MGRFAIVPVVCTLALLLVMARATLMPVLAQEASPAASLPAGLIVPDPAECDVPPRSIAFFEGLAASPPAVPPDADMRFSKPAMEPRPWTLPPGTPADAATVAEVTGTLHEALACLNANDPLRFLALFTDEMLDIFFAIDPLPPEAVPSLAASPVLSPPDQRLGYLSVHDARILPDGRVAALADDYDPTEPPFGLGTDFAIFAKAGDRWLIDSLIENVTITGEGTPVP
jgi:hypothetical protein